MTWCARGGGEAGSAARTPSSEQVPAPPRAPPAGRTARLEQALVSLIPAADRSPSEVAVARPVTRYETTRRRAALEHREINEIMAALAPEKRALVGAVAPSALALHNMVERMTSDLRELDGPLDVEKDVTRSVFVRLDRAVDAMRALKLALQELNDTGSLTHVDQLNATAERARFLVR